MVFHFVKPSALQNWISVNAAGSLKQEPGDSWRAYLTAQAATGATISELERSFLSATGSGSLLDRWSTWLGVNGGGTGDIRTRFQTKFK